MAKSNLRKKPTQLMYHGLAAKEISLYTYPPSIFYFTLTRYATSVRIFQWNQGNDSALGTKKVGDVRTFVGLRWINVLELSQAITYSVIIRWRKPDAEGPKIGARNSTKQILIKSD
jgi:hypothetical protein